MISNGSHRDGNSVQSNDYTKTDDQKMPPNGSEKPLPADPSREVPHTESVTPEPKDTQEPDPNRSRLSVADAVDAMVKRGSMVKFRGEQAASQPTFMRKVRAFAAEYGFEGIDGEANARKLFMNNDVDRSEDMDMMELRAMLVQSGCHLDDAEFGALAETMDSEKRGLVSFEQFFNAFELISGSQDELY